MLELDTPRDHLAPSFILNAKLRSREDKACFHCFPAAQGQSWEGPTSAPQELPNTPSPGPARASHQMCAEPLLRTRHQVGTREAKVSVMLSRPPKSRRERETAAPNHPRGDTCITNSNSKCKTSPTALALPHPPSHFLSGWLSVDSQYFFLTAPPYTHIHTSQCEPRTS